MVDGEEEGEEDCNSDEIRATAIDRALHNEGSATQCQQVLCGRRDRGFGEEKRVLPGVSLLRGSVEASTVRGVVDITSTVGRLER